MKLIGAMSGIAAMNIPGEEVVPPAGILQRDMISYLSNLYGFSVLPQFHPGSAELAILQFQAGICSVEDEHLPISQIIVTADGDAVYAKDTDIADRVLTHFMSRLEQDLGFRYSGSTAKRMHQSFVLVEFDNGFVNSFAKVQGIIADAVSDQYAIKRLIFGHDASNYAPGTPTIHQFFGKEFVIERRANEPMASNRFFCAAPLRIRDHLAALEKIEAAMS